MRVDRPSKEALEEITSLLRGEDRERRVFVDFDHSLFLSNSTEEFLGSARPAFLAAIILKVLATIRPWLLLSRDRGYFVWRDAIRVWCIIILMPWTLFLFRRKAPQLFNRYLNQGLAQALRQSTSDKVIIISFGFGFIIRQLIRESEFVRARLVASGIWHPARLRLRGKLRQMEIDSIAADPATDIVITDSDEDDSDLLATFSNGFHVQWPDQKTLGAHHGIYLPFYYLAKIKRSPEFFLKSTLLEEYPLFVLAFILYQPLHWTVMLSGSLLFLGFLIVYEIGYHENDHIGARHERAPKLSEEFHRQQSYRIEPSAWYWLIGLTVIAIALLDQQFILSILARLGITEIGSHLQAQALLIGLWVFMAVLVRLTFYVFNHVPLLWRIFVFFPLHLLKYFSPAIFFSLQPAGFALLSAQVIRTWSVYAIRRCGGDVEFIVSQLIRLMFLVLLLVGFALWTSFGTVFAAWQTWVILAWCIVRSFPEIRRKMFHRDVLAEFVPWFGHRKDIAE